MTASDDRQLDLEVERHLLGSCQPWRTPRRYARDSFAQALLLNHLERLGFVHAFSAPLEFELRSGARVRSACSRVECPRSGRAFVCYAAGDGEALVGAALMALRAVAFERVPA